MMDLVEGKMTLAKILSLLTLLGMMMSCIGMFATSVWWVSNLNRDVEANTAARLVAVDKLTYDNHVERQAERNADFLYNDRTLAGQLGSLSERVSKLEGGQTQAFITPSLQGRPVLREAVLRSICTDKGRLQWTSTSNEQSPRWRLPLPPPSARQSPVPLCTSLPKIGSAKTKVLQTKSSITLSGPLPLSS